MANSSPSSSKPLINQVDWYAIASKIRIQNQTLKSQIGELKTVIEEQKQQIKVQVIKNQDYSSLEENQQEKLRQLESQITEKEAQINNQKSIIDNLTQELEKIQQHTARLERECSLLQDNYNEQENQLKQVEKENKELKIRLQRQQRYNIQYKTALDQVINASSGEDSVNSVINSFPENNLPPSFLAQKNPLTSIKTEENPVNKTRIDSNQPKELTENFLENSGISPKKIDNSNDNLLNSPLNNLEDKKDIFPQTEIKESNVKQETFETNNNQAQEDKKPKRRMFIQLPQFGRKKEED